MEHDQQLRNLRDFLMVYNRMTEICFQRCSSNFNYRNLTMDEDRCVDNCAGKLIRSNHRLMGSYVQLMPKMVQRRMDEMQSKAAEAEAAAAAAAGAAGGGGEAGAAASVTASPATTELSVDQTSPLSPPSFPSLADTDAAGPLQAPAGPGQPLGVGPGVSVPALEPMPASLVRPTQSGVAAPPLPLAPPETLSPTQVDHLVVGPASAAVSPLPGPFVSGVRDPPLPVAHSAPPAAPGPSAPTPTGPESLAADVSTISKV
ncbi:unnamed protein product [Merluccius merluccius]